MTVYMLEIIMLKNMMFTFSKNQENNLIIMSKSYAHTHTMNIIHALIIKICIQLQKHLLCI